MKNILGLDLGTNSIGWALVKHSEEEQTGEIIAANSRIIPMDQAMLGDFETGNKVSNTAIRTEYRGKRRLYERAYLRRERLHRVLNLLNFLPPHYAKDIDFDLHPGKFINYAQPKINYVEKVKGEYEFFFKSSFNEMLQEFSNVNPTLVANGRRIPYDWIIYYLRKKALSEKIEKAELAWILLNFNQKRGYYQLRDDNEDEKSEKLEEFYSLKVVDIVDSGERRGDNVWYNVILENEWVYRRQSRVLLDWVGKVKDFIVTTDVDENGNIKKDKLGVEKRSFRAPSPDDWTLLKKKTEKDIENSAKTVGCYIYETLLTKPDQKIRGKLVSTIERKFYKDELRQILNKQKEFHPEFNDRSLYEACVNELYPNNEKHRKSIEQKDLINFFIEDILFYQRPLKSKKSEISVCGLEPPRVYIKNGERVTEPIRCIPKSHPLFQEFRLWKFIQNLKIYKKFGEIEDKPATDIDVTSNLLPSKEALQDLFEWLNEKKEIKQDTLLRYPKFGLKKEIGNYRWNYVEDKTYPCNVTHAMINLFSQKAGIPSLDINLEYSLWHILYSVDDRQELIKALNSFAVKNNFPETFVESFRRFPSFDKEYGSFSAKAIRKLLSLMRVGKYWTVNSIDERVVDRINKLIDGEWDDNISEKVREKAIKLTCIEDFQGLPEWLASYVIYNRHSEAEDLSIWKSPDDIDYYLNSVFKQHSLKNPVVEQVVTETLRVVRDIWSKYGNGKPGFFDEIHIELGRNIKNTAEKRRSISERNQANENTNMRIKAMLAEFKESGVVENVRPHSPAQQEILKIFEEDILKAEKNVDLDILKISRSATPSKSEIQRYRLWLEQKYCSPYTGNVIPLGRLFTPDYEIEHIIPQSRYFDDSLSNKVICEAAVNKHKGNKLAYEYIQERGGEIVELGFGGKTKVLSSEAYKEFVKTRYAGNRAKMNKLLLEDIPESFIERQLNDSRYISRFVQKLLSPLVRLEKDDEGGVAKNIVSCNGTITSELKQHWGLNDVWNDIITPRFVRLNILTQSENFGEWTDKGGKRVFQTKVPLSISKGFSKKRIDHRHHAMDAIIIACATRNHVNYLNNKYSKSENERFDLRSVLCEKRKTDDKGNYKWIFKKPWSTFTQDTKEMLSSMIVSFKQNLRVINKTINHYQKWVLDEEGNRHKRLVKQVKGDAWAIRKPMHKETYYGKITLREIKEVNLSSALDNWELLVDKKLRSFIKELIGKYGKFDKKMILKYFKDRDYRLEEQDVKKVKVYQINSNYAVSRTTLDASFNRKKIESISDTGIQKILLKHLEKYNELSGDKVIEHPELAFSPDGIDSLNQDLTSLNNGKHHKPIYKVRTYEPIGNKFPVGTNGSKNTKYVEAAKGTNLFFAIYQDENGKRSYETIPLNVVVERQKQGLPSISEVNEKGSQLLFSLSPGDLVYVPTEDEIESGKIDWNDKKKMAERVYKVVSFTGNRLYCVPVNFAKCIEDKNELGILNKVEFDIIDSLSLKEFCVKIKSNRLELF